MQDKYTAMIGGAIGVNGSPVDPRKLAERLNKFEKIKQVVDKQAEDEGLWFDAETAPEAYLQKELRKLHGVVEN